MASSFISENNSKTPSYSQLLNDIQTGEVQSLVLIPARRQVKAIYKNGESFIVSIFPNDQLILRTAELSATDLVVKDISSEEAAASITASISTFIIFLIFCSFILKKSLGLLGKNLSFFAGNTKINDPSSIDTKFQDVAGIPEAVDEVREIVSFLSNPEIYTKMGARLPKGFLLVGPPGTGKTLLAKAIAGEANVPFISTTASEFVELFVGIGATRVRSVFAQAKEKKPCIIFIDEIDAIGRQRGIGLGGGNDEREQTLNQLLTEMDGFTDNSGIIVIAATNRADILDQALIRPGRFDRVINVNLPDRKGRLQILSIHSLSKPLSEEVDLNDWANKTVGFSGAELCNLLNEAAIIAARDNQSSIGTRQLNKSIDKITIGQLTNHGNSYIHQKIIAYNEAGKALLAYLTKCTDKVDKITILRRPNDIGGFTRLIPSDENLDSGIAHKKYLFSKLIVALGGRAMETIVFGESELTQISCNNLKQATIIAREMVMQYGFSSLGLISIPTNSVPNYLGRELLRSKSIYANKTTKAIDGQVRLLLKRAMSIALEKLNPQRKVADQIVNELIYEESISSKRFNEILSDNGL
ncbi:MULTISPECIES: ATP-dependent metallopeptidase FtsH/Yme1/Tma family protein [Prochlorococcus]|uniref:ATP-dependent zinc metalloprotease FtsH n=1 Tax=Prochlorococcus marinus (strain SARG / CCMP1375 / SS120) TaxID=167539 RepID=Q7VBW2_PROMA|nr:MULTISPECIES: FtsH/Yme1/Tma family ATP-dependent metallopeptidase [Prochlorococcus]AAQ00025.1 Cell division protein FtsH [Prochlorococcus marinus subsp. marinus str. CCMP1375]KGG13821.1 Cell division protein FtsH [Prochlorococcus marinus str. LG]KGG18955.1 Cell division protein FtsH [Prochlorococcus marinus str. SS2]KGG23506.1 Cell division protein FtsH [Prochlorococcus marinus str. SS35]KGG32258.1 Cell division protein FtsH [Prochlorococcus marinus str. SS51]